MNRLKAGELDPLLSSALILKDKHRVFEHSQTWMLQACMALKTGPLDWQMIAGGLVLCPCDDTPGAPSIVLNITTLLSLTHELPALQLPGIDSFCWQDQGQVPHCHSQRALICTVKRLHSKIKCILASLIKIISLGIVSQSSTVKVNIKSLSLSVYCDLFCLDERFSNF